MARCSGANIGVYPFPRAMAASNGPKPSAIQPGTSSGSKPNSSQLSFSGAGSTPAYVCSFAWDLLLSFDFEAELRVGWPAVPVHGEKITLRW